MEGLDLKQMTAMIDIIAEEKGLSRDIVIGVIEQAIAAAWRKDNGDREMNVRAILNVGTGEADVYVAREIIEDGATGCLVPQNDDERMAECVVKLLSDNKLRETIVEHATRQISKYSEEVAVSRIIDCYHCLN